MSLELGYIYYFFQDTPGTLDTQEVYLSAGVEDIFWGIGASATFYYDFDSNNGWYLQPEITKSFSLMEGCLSLDLSAGVGVADGHGLQLSDSFGSVGTADGFQGWYVKAELPWQFRENMAIAPYIKYVDADSDLVSDTPLVGGTGTLGGREHLVAGVKLSVSF